MALTEEQKQTFIQHMSRFSGTDIAHLLLEALDQKAITEQQLVAFAQRIWNVYKAQRQATLDAQIAALQAEKDALNGVG